MRLGASGELNQVAEKAPGAARLSQNIEMQLGQLLESAGVGGLQFEGAVKRAGSRGGLAKLQFGETETVLGFPE